MCDSLQPHELQHTRLPCPSPSPGICSDSCPLSWWCYLMILSSAAPFSSCPQSFPTSGSFSTSWLFTSCGQSIGASASAVVLSMNVQDWSSGWTGWISCRLRASQESPPAPQFENICSSALAFFMVQLSRPCVITPSRCTNWVQKKQGNRRSNQHPLDHRESVWNYPAHRNWLHIWGLVSLSIRTAFCLWSVYFSK